MAIKYLLQMKDKWQSNEGEVWTGLPLGRTKSLPLNAYHCIAKMYSTYIALFFVDLCKLDYKALQNNQNIFKLCQEIYNKP